jgi:hypothetical protein
MIKATAFFNKVITCPELLNLTIGLCLDGSIDDVQNIIEDLDSVFPGLVVYTDPEDNPLKEVLDIIYEHYMIAQTAWADHGWLDGHVNRPIFENLYYDHGEPFKDHHAAYAWGINKLITAAKNF